jgi:Fe-S cluster assembly ATP-binding protein
MNLQIHNLHASIGDKKILQGLTLELENGKIYALMGPNGSGKSTLANVVMGHPAYTVTEGSIMVNGENILDLPTHERARRGLFLAFQYPVEVPGVTVGKFLKRALESHSPDSKVNLSAYVKKLREMVAFLEMDQQFINRYLNQGFSGGEKKRLEMLQMLMLDPQFAILDETDSGLDIDALKVVSKGVNKLRSNNFGALIITHYQRILKYIEPDVVHVMVKGRIARTGGPELVTVLEERGYDWVRAEAEEAEYANAERN